MPEVLKMTTGTTVAFGDVVQLSKERSQDPESDGFERYIGLEHLEPSDLKVRSWGNISDGITFTSVFRPGQVLFGKRRAYQRKVAIADFSGVCSGDIYVLEPKGDQLLPELLPFICQSESFYDYMISMSQGGLSPRVNWKALAKYDFVLPPLEEQRRIAEVLQAIESCHEKLRQAQDSLSTTLDSVATHLLSSYACDRSVADYFHVNPETLTRAQLLSCEVWDYADLSSTTFPLDLSDLKAICLSEAPSRAKRIVANGDVLVSTVRPNLKGHAFVSSLDSKIVASTGFAVLRPRNKEFASIIAGIILSSRFLQYCEGRVSGGLYPAIRASDVSHFPMPDLDLLIQKGYSQVFDRLLLALKEAQSRQLTCFELKKTLRNELLQ